MMRHVGPVSGNEGTRNLQNTFPARLVLNIYFCSFYEETLQKFSFKTSALYTVSEYRKLLKIRNHNF